MKPSMPLKSYVLYAFLLLVIAMGIVYVRLPQDIRNSARKSGTSLSMQASGENQPNGSTFTVGIALNAGSDSVTAVQLKIAYDPNLLEITNFTPGSKLPVILTPATFSGGIASVDLGANPNAYLTGTDIIGTFTIQSKTDNPATLAFTDETQTASLDKDRNSLSSKTGITINRTNSTSTPTTTTSISSTRTPTPSRTHRTSRTPTPTKVKTPTPTPTEPPAVSNTPTPTQAGKGGGKSQTIRFKVKLAGVTGAEANGAKVGVKFYRKNGTITQLSAPVSLTHAGGGVYDATAVITNPIPEDTQIRIKVKSEKHIAVEFCRQSGQTKPCADGEYIKVPKGPPASYVFDFTGIPLPPGDLDTQDGRVDSSDLSRMTAIMSKLSTSLTAADKLVGDVDYNGYVNIRDLFLVLKTLETRYDD